MRGRNHVGAGNRGTNIAEWQWGAEESVSIAIYGFRLGVEGDQKERFPTDSYSWIFMDVFVVLNFDLTTLFGRAN